MEHRKSDENSKDSDFETSLSFTENLRNLLDDPVHSDITFIVGEQSDRLKAHKAILSARSEYFRAMFKEGGMAESLENEVILKDHDKSTIRRM